MTDPLEPAKLSRRDWTKHNGVFVPPARAALPKHSMAWPCTKGEPSLRVFYEVQRPTPQVPEGSVNLMFVPIEGVAYRLSFDFADHQCCVDGLTQLAERIRTL